MDNKKKKKQIKKKKIEEVTKRVDIPQQESVKKSKKVRDKKNKKKHPKLWLTVKILIIIMLLIALAGAGVVAGIFMGFFGDDFKLTEEQLNVGELNTEVYDRDGKLIEVLNGKEIRKWIDIGDMPEYLPKAFVSIEDERFYDHQGVDLQRTATATIKYVLSKVGIGESSYGGSTITQQLVKNLTDEDEREWTRKVKEMARAINLEKELSKKQILELYLNLIFLGGEGMEIHGVEMASQYYFNKSAKDLNLAECAFLAGINSSPNYYAPFSEEQEEIDKIKNKTKVVLNKMKELGAINTEEDYNTAVEQVELGLAFEQGKIIQNVYSYHTDAAIEQIIDQLVEENENWSRVMAEQYLFGGGFKIYTTQHSWIQEVAEGETSKSTYQVPSSNKEKAAEGVVSQTAMVIMDHKTGQVLATIGGTGEKTTSRGYNFATMEPKQTGSSMKPLSVIAPAVQNGIITAGSVYDDVPTKFGNAKEGWPANHYGGYKGLSTVRAAITISGNVIPTRILNEMGVDKSIEFLESVGITTLNEKDRTLSLALGGLDVGITPLEMAGAYAAIANDGEYITPTFYTRIEDSNGNIVLEPKQERRRVMSVENAYIVKSILTAPVVGSGGTATNCRIPNMEVCAKTGSTDNYNDRWLCGFTPYYTATVWFGYKESEPVHGFGVNPAGQIWANVMKPIHDGLEAASFVKPQNITYATICRDSGLLATDLCKNDPRGSRAYSEVYVKGTAPTKQCDCHVEAEICKSSGKIATENCPETKKEVFITRKDTKDNWKVAQDAEYMLPEKKCTKHKNAINNNIINNTVTNSSSNTTNKNTTTKNNTVNSSTTKNNTTTNNSKNTATNTNKVTNSASSGGVNQNLTSTIN